MNKKRLLGKILNSMSNIFACAGFICLCCEAIYRAAICISLFYLFLGTHGFFEMMGWVEEQ
ncbi:hypothetical protein KAR26_02140 [Candidatus Parcubacteria bacterium]|nr:hypothetical protein [Candidatus Parcubacteria bacterium]MCK5584146.1 hypothetical protein [Elusimicrobiales bacterium]